MQNKTITNNTHCARRAIHYSLGRRAGPPVTSDRHRAICARALPPPGIALCRPDSRLRLAPYVGPFCNGGKEVKNLISIRLKNHSTMVFVEIGHKSELNCEGLVWFRKKNQTMTQISSGVWKRPSSLTSPAAKGVRT